MTTYFHSLVQTYPNGTASADILVECDTNEGVYTRQGNVCLNQVADLARLDDEQLDRLGDAYLSELIDEHWSELDIDWEGSCDLSLAISLPIGEENQICPAAA